MKVIILSPFNGDVNLSIGDSHDFPVEEVISLVEAGIATPSNQKAYNALIEKQKQKQQKLEDAEKRAAAILHEDVLKDERRKLQNRVDEITDALDDGIEFYQDYANHLDSLKKKDK